MFHIITVLFVTTRIIINQYSDVCMHKKFNRTIHNQFNSTFGIKTLRYNISFYYFSLYKDRNSIQNGVHVGFTSSVQHPDAAILNIDIHTCVDMIYTNMKFNVYNQAWLSLHVCQLIGIWLSRLMGPSLTLTLTLTLNWACVPQTGGYVCPFVLTDEYHPWHTLNMWQVLPLQALHFVSKSLSNFESF